MSSNQPPNRTDSVASGGTVSSYYLGTNGVPPNATNSIVSNGTIASYYLGGNSGATSTMPIYYQTQNNVDSSGNVVTSGTSAPPIASGMPAEYYPMDNMPVPSYYGATSAYQMPQYLLGANTASAFIPSYYAMPNDAMPGTMPGTVPGTVPPMPPMPPMPPVQSMPPMPPMPPMMYGYPAAAAMYPATMPSSNSAISSAQYGGIQAGNTTGNVANIIQDSQSPESPPHVAGTTASSGLFNTQNGNGLSNIAGPMMPTSMNPTASLSGRNALQQSILAKNGSSKKSKNDGKKPNMPSFGMGGPTSMFGSSMGRPLNRGGYNAFMGGGFGGNMSMFGGMRGEDALAPAEIPSPTFSPPPSNEPAEGAEPTAEQKAFAAKRRLRMLFLEKLGDGSVLIETQLPGQAKIAQAAGVKGIIAMPSSDGGNHPFGRRGGGGSESLKDHELLKFIDAVALPVITHVRVGHTMEAKRFEKLGVNMLEESSKVSAFGDLQQNGDVVINKKEFYTPFMAGVSSVKEALRHVKRGVVFLYTKTGDGSGDCSSTIKGLRNIHDEINTIKDMDDEELDKYVEEHKVDKDLLLKVKEQGRLPVPLYASGGLLTPVDIAQVRLIGCDGIILESSVFQVLDPVDNVSMLIRACKEYKNAQTIAELSRNFKTNMPSVGGGGGGSGGFGGMNPAMMMNRFRMGGLG